MGYRTAFTLSIHDGADLLPDDIDDLDFDDFTGDAAYVHAKWHTYEEDMKAYSKKHPGITFRLDGSGEDDEDMWRAYFKDGKVFHADAKIVFEDYSEDKLV